MNPPDRRWIRVFRRVSLFLPLGVAWWTVLLTRDATPLGGLVSSLLGALLLTTSAAVLIRLVGASVVRRRRGGGEEMTSGFDVLTASGSAMAWLGAGALVLSTSVGWASLSVVGLLGLGVLHAVVFLTLLRVGGADPWRRASFSRSFVASRVTEGDAVIEELRFRSPRVPAGFRLFAKGSVGRRWPLSRYVVESAESGGEVRLVRDVGPARRGEYDAEPLVVWLEDVLGLCQSSFGHAGGGEHLTVLPDPRRIQGAQHLLGLGGSDDEPRTEERLPTEGSLRLREYQQGDDARRIHWLRSLTRGEIVVRLPDELPPDEPAVRLVLDTFLPGAHELTCDAPGVLLDALVRVWLGTGRALVDAGVQVTLVAAVAKGEGFTTVTQRLVPRALAPALRLGARASWQAGLPASTLLSKARSIIVSHRLPASTTEATARWIVVPAELWTPFAELPQRRSLGLLPYRIGSADNRWSRRRQERLRRETSRCDHAALGALTAHGRDHRAGNFVARARAAGAIELEALS